jgi:hypothetical protein
MLVVTMGETKTHIKRFDALKSHNKKEHAWPHKMPIRTVRYS